MLLRKQTTFLFAGKLDEFSRCHVQKTRSDGELLYEFMTGFTAQSISSGSRVG